MDIGKKCLIMAIVGMILASVSSPFVVNMLFNGKPITMLTPKEVSIPCPPQEYGPISKIITGMEKIMEVPLNPTRGEQYKVSLNVATNGTINVLVFEKSSASIIQNSFNAGNHTKDLMITANGTYVVNATILDNSVVKATFKITESWLLKITEWEEQVDILKTVGSSMGFVFGLAILLYSLVRLRKEAETARPGKSREAFETGYVEVEEE
ncbi:MAG: hypothetical protein HA496_00660 [Thaumarchaeota archaeon]|jgi:hypothetical protein|nr:hypothetical protein [Nitrososphaerota archaeon]